MDVIAVLACVVVACCVLRTPIMKAPAVLYLLAFVLDILFIAGWAGVLPQSVWGVLLLLVLRCLLAFSLLAVVMFVGVLPRGSKARAWLGAIRAELSVAACIVLIGHVAFYAASYLPRLAAGAGAAILLGIVAAIALVVLALVLGVTSLRAVKARMDAQVWRRIQRFAYAFYALIYVHVLAMLLPSALKGGEAALQSVVVYTVVFAAYAILRIWRAFADRRAELSDAFERRDSSEEAMA